MLMGLHPECGTVPHDFAGGVHAQRRPRLTVLCAHATQARQQPRMNDVALSCRTLLHGLMREATSNAILTQRAVQLHSALISYSDNTYLYGTGRCFRELALLNRLAHLAFIEAVRSSRRPRVSAI